MKLASTTPELATAARASVRASIGRASIGTSGERHVSRHAAHAAVTPPSRRRHTPTMTSPGASGPPARPSRRASCARHAVRMSALDASRDGERQVSTDLRASRQRHASVTPPGARPAPARKRHLRRHAARPRQGRHGRARGARGCGTCVAPARPGTRPTAIICRHASVTRPPESVTPHCGSVTRQRGPVTRSVTQLRPTTPGSHPPRQALPISKRPARGGSDLRQLHVEDGGLATANRGQAALDGRGHLARILHPFAVGVAAARQGSVVGRGREPHAGKRIGAL